MQDDWPVLSHQRIIGIGNAAIDIVCTVPDKLLLEFGAKKASCIFPDLAEFSHISSELNAYNIETLLVPGGAAANTLCTISVLGGKTAFIGKLSDDIYGDTILESFARYGVAYSLKPLPQTIDRSTSLYAFITPDGERSFASYYGASNHLVPDDLAQQSFDDCAMLYVDSYILMSAHGFEITLAAIQKAKAHNAFIVLNPSSLSVLEARPEAYNTLMGLADAVMCNEEEAIAITGAATPPLALEILAKGRLFATVTCGAQGALATMNGHTEHVPNPPLIKPLVNTNGAGDNYAGGFLYGIIKGMPLRECISLGLACAVKVLYEDGPRPPITKVKVNE